MTERTIRLDLAYDGTGFRGWAAQGDPSIRTIEGTLSDHLERILRERPRLSVAGRTDAGVHARGQVASFVADTRVTPQRLQAALNSAVAPEVVLTRVSFAPAGFDARFSASAREYRYVIDTAPLPDPFGARFVWHRPGTLRVPAMRQAARSFVGEHDFSAFCRHPGEGRSAVREIQRFTVRRTGASVEISILANAFVHQMVRSLVGTMVAVGEGRMAAADAEAILAARDRSAASSPAPTRGLTLERVVYGRRTLA